MLVQFHALDKGGQLLSTGMNSFDRLNREPLGWQK
jgi:hypothetical protein